MDSLELPSPPVFLSVTGLYDVEFRILVTCRFVRDRNKAKEHAVQGRSPLSAEAWLASCQGAVSAGQPAGGIAQEGEEHHHRLHGSDLDVSHQ